MADAGPETHTRRCPACQGLVVTRVGRPFAVLEAIKERLRCDTCHTYFVFVWKKPPAPA